MSLLLVGLGNRPLPNTRHSVGHLLVDALATRFAIRLSQNKSLGGFIGRSQVLGVDLTLFKPSASPPCASLLSVSDAPSDALMNISGPAVAAALRHTARTPADLVVIHDSLQHKPKTFSPKFGGSANGHNGVRSVIAALGSDPNFLRFRIGIGRDGDAASYVLGRLSAEEITHWSAGVGLDEVSKHLEKILSARCSQSNI